MICFNIVHVNTKSSMMLRQSVCMQSLSSVLSVTTVPTFFFMLTIHLDNADNADNTYPSTV